MATTKEKGSQYKWKLPKKKSCHGEGSPFYLFNIFSIAIPVFWGRHSVFVRKKHHEVKIFREKSRFRKLSGFNGDNRNHTHKSSCEQFFFSKPLLDSLENWLDNRDPYYQRTFS